VIKWRRYIVDAYVKNLKLKLEERPYNHRFIKDFSFDPEEQAYLESIFDLNDVLGSETPLIDLMNSNRIDLVHHFLYESQLGLDVNQVKAGRSLFIFFLIIL
jgi:hypothetical protein